MHWGARLISTLFAAQLFAVAPALSDEQKDAPVGSEKSSASSHMIYGRVEELDKAAEPTLPADLRPGGNSATAPENGLKAGAAVEASYPSAFTGQWGGFLQMRSHRVYPAYYELDQKAADRMEQTASAMSRGAINFRFEQDGDRTALRPTYCLFIIHIIPGVIMDPGANILINVPVELGFSGGCLAGRGPAGNKFEADLVKDSIVKLSPAELEEDTVCDTREWNTATHKPQQCYSEGVLRFEQTAPDALKVHAFRLRYGADGRALWMITVDGMVYRGVKVNDSPPH
ncbi:MAG: hypothetical protein ACRD3W_12670 [Terriglobales bacterium]